MPDASGHHHLELGKGIIIRNPLAAIAIPATTCALATALYAFLAHSGDALFYRLWYYTPAAALAGAFTASRLLERPHGKARWLIDLLVAAICLARPLTGQPPISGHAWFCIHALLTCSHPLTRSLALLVTGITLYAKIILWHSDTTLWPGLIAGLLSGWAWRKSHPAKPKTKTTPPS
ncbi:hypothetical protein [Haloferula sp. BvORR071]|uniref:hypothetical protein n=1 Tax=Haloferula sp. BvORR071 TaxID=1396141 RepID=UPI000551AE5D|nr:hypothetical protein [Haloferula sp. BvORR071]